MIKGKSFCLLSTSQLVKRMPHTLPDQVPFFPYGISQITNIFIIQRKIVLITQFMDITEKYKRKLDKSKLYCANYEDKLRMVNRLDIKEMTLAMTYY